MKKLHLTLVLLILIGLFVPGCIPKAANCGQPEVFCIGLVTDGGTIDDHSYNQAAWEGIQQAKSTGAADWIASIETVDIRDYNENIRVFADAGYDMIVTVGSAMGDATRTEASAYPNSYFIGVDQDQSANQEFIPNLVGLVFPEDQIGYLAGALGALLSKSGKIGAVLGSDVSPSMQKYGQGFSAGAASVNRDVTATVVYHNEVGLDKTFSDPEWGATQANTLVDGEADIIFGVGGTTGSNAIVAAVMRGAYGIGTDTDEYYSLPVAAPHLYTSILKMISPGIVELIKAGKDAQAQISGFPGGNYTGLVGLAPYHDLDSTVPEDIKTRMSDLTQALSSGDIQTGVP